MQSLPSTNGLSTIVSKNVCFYKGVINLRYTDRLTVMSSIKECEMIGKLGNIGIESVTFYNKKDGFNEAISIYGYYPSDLSNHNEIFENLYALFQFLCIKCKQPYVLFYLHNDDSKEYKEYKIVPK